MKISQFARNHLVIENEEGRLFQSYDSVIVKIDIKGKVTLGRDWNYSRTTAKYRNMFLGETTRETAKKLADGVYEMVDLNNEVIE